MNRNETSIRRIAFLVSCASALQIAESLIPSPLPGVRLGLANMITLVALVRMGYRTAFEITLLRTVVSSFILGTFLSPAFFLSASGGLASTAVMAAWLGLSGPNGRFRMSMIGLSLWGAVTHNFVQILLVYVFLVKHSSVFYLAPWLGISSVVTGWITGLVAVKVCARLDRNEGIEAGALPEIRPESRLRSDAFVPADTWVHAARPELKIAAVLIVGLAVVLQGRLVIDGVLLAGLLAVLAASRTPWIAVRNKALKMWPLILFSAVTPALLGRGGRVLVHAGAFSVTETGLTAGILFASRIILLMIAASLLVWTTRPEELAEGLRKLLNPFRIFGWSPDRFSRILTLSWTSLPEFRVKIRGLLASRRPAAGNLRAWIPALGDVVAALYLEAGREEIAEMKYSAASSGVSQRTLIMNAASGGESSPSGRRRKHPEAGDLLMQPDNLIPTLRAATIEPTQGG
jgi:heptaprenyl diphosphate synthase